MPGKKIGSFFVHNYNEENRGIEIRAFKELDSALEASYAFNRRVILGFKYKVRLSGRTEGEILAGMKKRRMGVAHSYMSACLSGGRRTIHTCKLAFLAAGVESTIMELYDFGLRLERGQLVMPPWKKYKKNVRRRNRGRDGKLLPLDPPIGGRQYKGGFY